VKWEYENLRNGLIKRTRKVEKHYKYNYRHRKNRNILPGHSEKYRYQSRLMSFIKVFIFIILLCALLGALICFFVVKVFEY
jgi:hypothetical protein